MRSLFFSAGSSYSANVAPTSANLLRTVDHSATARPRLHDHRRRDPSRRNPSRRDRRSGFTLLEVMIATAITLLMMISLVQVFKIIGDSMKQGRAALQMNNTLRSVTFRLRNDLSNLTVRVDPPADSRSGGGYLEYFDGSMTDYSYGMYIDASQNRFGDLDDILMFTARAGDAWFTGQVPERILIPNNSTSNTPVTITSQLAEIAVFARPLPAASGAPTQYRLHYRVLLIRPDLNTFPAANPQVLPNLTVNGTAPTSMAPLFQECDLSMHRLYDGNSSTPDRVSANSLEDLTNPVNRFAHFQFQIPNTQSGTMPLLVMDPSSYNVLGTAALPFPDPTGIALANGHFLHPDFVLTGLNGSRVGEDILATNVLAFDVKGYDAGAPILATVGPDGVFGVPGNLFAGADGSDDVILTPNDPGYGAAVTDNATLVGTGAYVDLLWGRKTLNTPNSSFLASRYVSELSGLSPLNNFSESLLRSGKVIPGSVIQPVFDTWTTQYESNGLLEAKFDAFRGTCSINAWNRMFGNTSGNPAFFEPPWRLANFDAGTDGIDNNGTGGVDEAAERETMPPFPVKLRGLKISIRIEDAATRQVKQMSVANEFVTQ